MKNNNGIKTFVAVGIGAALFFVLGRFVAIPSPVPNTNISLQYAVLASSEKTISEITYEVGFTSPSYFTKCYKDYFGESPTDFLKRRG